MDFCQKLIFGTKIDIRPHCDTVQACFSHAMYKLHFSTKKTWLRPKKTKTKKSPYSSGRITNYIFHQDC